MKCNQARAKDGKPENRFPKHVKGSRQIQPESTTGNRIPFSSDSQGPVAVQGRAFHLHPLRLHLLMERLHTQSVSESVLVLAALKVVLKEISCSGIRN